MVQIIFLGFADMAEIAYLSFFILCDMDQIGLFGVFG